MTFWTPHNIATIRCGSRTFAGRTFTVRHLLVGLLPVGHLPVGLLPSDICRTVCNKSLWSKRTAFVSILYGVVDQKGCIFLEKTLSNACCFHTQPLRPDSVGIRVRENLNVKFFLCGMHHESFAQNMALCLIFSILTAQDLSNLLRLLTMVGQSLKIEATDALKFSNQT